MSGHCRRTWIRGDAGGAVAYALIDLISNIHVSQRSRSITVGARTTFGSSFGQEGSADALKMRSRTRSLRCLPQLSETSTAFVVMPRNDSGCIVSVEHVQ